MDDGWLRAMEERAEIGTFEKVWLSTLFVASLLPLVIAVFQGSLFALVMGVLGLSLFVRSVMLLVAEREENRKQVADIRERYESLPPQDREYLDEHFIPLKKGRWQRLINRAELRPNRKGNDDE